MLIPNNAVVFLYAVTNDAATLHPAKIDPPCSRAVTRLFEALYFFVQKECFFLQLV
jgi:hypothetical protein